MLFDPEFRDDRLDHELWQRAMIQVALPSPGRYGTLRAVRQTLSAVPVYGQQLTFSAPLPWTCLYEGDTLWMSDTPQERLMMVMGTTGMVGHVLVAGGGLGLYPQFLRRYQPVERITVVERHPDVVTMLAETLAGDTTIQVIRGAFEEFILAARPQRYDSCYIDIHPTLDPRWIPGLNWLRDQCSGIVSGPLRVWGYQWMTREYLAGIEREHLPLLRRGLYFDDPVGRDLHRELPPGWRQWSEPTLRRWLMGYIHRTARPLDWAHLPPVDVAVGQRTATSLQAE